MAMPVYTMNLFRLPKDFCYDLEQELAKFWWGSTTDKRRTHWFSWSRLCQSKRDGGIGFRDIARFNQALLAKQAWRILHKPESLMARMMKNRYFRDTNILNAKQGQKASYLWRSLLHGRDLLLKGLRITIGTGRTTQAWLDPWLPLDPPRPPRKKHGFIPNIMVSNLLNDNGTDWDIQKLEDQVHHEDVDHIRMIKISRHSRMDYLGWHYTKNGTYSVKSGYWLNSRVVDPGAGGPPIQPIPGNRQLKWRLWNIQTAPKIKHFCWKILSSSLPTGENMRRRHIPRNPNCPRCCNSEETTNHLFFDCPYAQAVWRVSGYPLLHTGPGPETFDDWFQFFLTPPSHFDSFHKQYPLWILWRLWTTRNILIFQRRQVPWTTLLRQARQDATQWLHNNSPSSSVPVVDVPGSVTDTWSPPPLSWVKYNYDGSYIPLSPAGAGWSIRDSAGQYLAGGHAQGRLVQTPLECELQALILAMQYCWSKGFRQIIFEGDNQEVHRIMEGRSSSFACNNWVQDCFYWKSKLGEVLFLWTKRQNNQDADALARIGSQSSVSYHTFVQPPWHVTL